ncbi:hypothetical protein BDV96DRAFT_572268 [Lophiotrema nucula]|uniref:BZIP domain-containing protein n=1 Tax=Lophiotrema nucula TaxID=690887 RepID=A0A6A5ZAG5_9PLEO|nr:hypothetical protein BDV96DRAFT_572268 [Lophiotrema nucula]
MKNFSFRQYRRSPKEDTPKDPAGDSKDKDNAQYLKRREQVRRAQRTHRERKEHYIKSLENEVLQLRTNEAKIVQETRNLYTEINRLKRLLDQHGILYGQAQGYSLPEQPLSDSSSAPSLSSISVVSNPRTHGQQLHIGGFGGSGPNTSNQFYLSESDGSPPSGSTLESSSKGLRKKLSFFGRRGHSDSEPSEGGGDFNTFSIPGQGPTSVDVSGLSASASALNLRDVDQTNLGMEFVLTLEAPCLHHTQGEPGSSSSQAAAPTGHTLTATAPLLFQNPTQPVDTSSTHSAPWDTTSLSLEKLLSLSSNFELSDEITPVQAWHQIRSHPDFDGVGVNGLKRLTEDMLKHVKCYGFGAVIETEIFAGLARNLFPGGGGFDWSFYG